MDRFEIEVVDPNAPASISTSTSPSPTAPMTFSSPIATSTQAPPQERSTPVGAIVGGLVGGLAFILVIVALSYWLWRRRRVRDNNIDEDGPDTTPTIWQLPPQPTSEIYPSSTIRTVKGRNQSVPANSHRNGPSFGSSSDWTSPTSWTAIQRREIDAGPVSVSDTADMETLPPEYEQVFQTGSRSSTRTRTTRPVRKQAS